MSDDPNERGKKKKHAEGGEMEEEGPPPEPETEEELALRLLHEDCDSKAMESLESTRRMLSMTEESKDAGIRTLVMLDEQGEQLERIDEGLDKINEDMRQAEKSLQDMEKCCGLCVLPWKKTKNFEKDPNYKDTWKSKEDGGGAEGPRPVVGQQMMVGGKYVTRITRDAREDEMEKNVDEVSNMIGNLRNMAVDMGTEVDSQNRLLNNVNRKVEMDETRIKEANKRANKLLKD